MADADPAWQRLVKRLSDASTSLEQKSSQLNRHCDRLVTKRDAEKGKIFLKDVTELAAHDITDIMGQLRSLEGFLKLHPHRRSVGVGLSQDAQAAMKAFETSHTTLVQRIQAIDMQASSQKKGSSRNNHKSSSSSSSSRREGLHDDAEDGEEAPLVASSSTGGGGSQQHQQQVQQQHIAVDIYEEIMHERSQEISEIADNIQTINEIFQHIKEMVDEQGEQLEAVETNVESAADRARAGREQLEKARAEQRSAHMKYIVAGCIVLFFVVTLVTVMMNGSSGGKKG